MFAAALAIAGSGLSAAWRFIRPIAPWILVAVVGDAGPYALLAGLFLSMLASIYPSWTASRMAPMEAMRIE